MNECSAFTSALLPTSLTLLSHHSTSSPFPSLNLHSEKPPASPSHSWVSSSHFYPFLSPLFVSSTLKTFLLSSPSFPSVFMFFSSAPFSSSLFYFPNHSRASISPTHFSTSHINFYFLLIFYFYTKTSTLTTLSLSIRFTSPFIPFRTPPSHIPLR